MDDVMDMVNSLDEFLEEYLGLGILWQPDTSQGLAVRGGKHILADVLRCFPYLSDWTSPEHDFVGRYLILLLLVSLGLLLNRIETYRAILTFVYTLKPSNVIIHILCAKR